MLTPTHLRETFEAARPYAPYVASGSADQQASWRRIYDRAALSPAQAALVGGFTRRVNVLVSSGLWCGDCAQQCPLVARIAEGNPACIDLRFVDRDEHQEFSDRVRICGGNRVPTAVFMAEDFEFCALFGDKSLSRFRAVAQRQLGAACPLLGGPLEQDELNATLQDWLNEFERVHLMVRLSARLRQKHGD
jgi:hypothetical protein